MKKVIAVVLGVVVLFVVLLGGFAFAQEKKDTKGCKDHPLFTRMPGTYISDCKSTEFDAMKWYDPDTQGKTEVQVEGKYYYILITLIRRSLREREVILRSHVTIRMP